MSFVVTEACIRCKYTECVDVCPVDAIFAEEDVPADQQDFTALNAELARQWRPITKTKQALPDAQTWAPIKVKRVHLER